MASTTNSNDVMNPRQIVVIGAGVVGLTTALKIQESTGYQTTILAETFPSDPKNIRYTSPWAGAHHISMAGHDTRLQKLDMDTFKVMWEMSAPGGAAEQCFLRLHHTQYYTTEVNDDCLEMMPNYKYVPKDALIPSTKSGIEFPTLTIDTPKYLNYLLSRFLAAGGSILRGTVQHITQVIQGGAPGLSGLSGATSRYESSSKVDAIVVCAGLGARSIGGVDDKGMFPIRGQTVLLRAPWVRFGRGLVDEFGKSTYTIPRRNGDVIVGGTKDSHDWYPIPRPETTHDMLTRALALCPDLAPPSIRETRVPTVDDLKAIVIEEGCGLRPAREGGVRIELEWFGDGYPVVHNYGHGGFGYQSSWASAEEATSLLLGALEKGKA